MSKPFADLLGPKADKLYKANFYEFMGQSFLHSACFHRVRASTARRAKNRTGARGALKSARECEKAADLYEQKLRALSAEPSGETDGTSQEIQRAEG